MTDQDKNKIIAEWLGLEVGLIHTIKNGVITGLIPDYLNTNAAFDLLDVLEDLGFGWDLRTSVVSAEEDQFPKICCIFSYNHVLWLVAEAPTKTAAICEAVLQLIEKEKQNG